MSLTKNISTDTFSIIVLATKRFPFSVLGKKTASERKIDQPSESSVATDQVSLPSTP